LSVWFLHAGQRPQTPIPHRLEIFHEEVNSSFSSCVAKSDGHFTPIERLHIQRELNQERRGIYRLKHNDRER